jgi:hypothetical protein
LTEGNFQRRGRRGTPDVGDPGQPAPAYLKAQHRLDPDLV